MKLAVLAGVIGRLNCPSADRVGALKGLVLQTAPDVFQQLPLLLFCFLDNGDLVSVDVVGDAVTNHLTQNVRPDGINLTAEVKAELLGTAVCGLRWTCGQVHLCDLVMVDRHAFEEQLPKVGKAKKLPKPLFRSAADVSTRRVKVSEVVDGGFTKSPGSKFTPDFVADDVAALSPARNHHQPPAAR